MTWMKRNQVSTSDRLWMWLKCTLSVVPLATCTWHVDRDVYRTTSEMRTPL